MRPINWTVDLCPIFRRAAVWKPVFRGYLPLLGSAISILLLISSLPKNGLAQSGRKRPPVPTSESAPPPAPPVIVPESTVVVGQEQVGDIAQFKLRNGITVVIDEIHAIPVVTALAYIRLGALDAQGAHTARCLEYSLTRPTGPKQARALAKFGALSASNSNFDHTEYSLTVQSSSLYDALSIQADMIQHASLDNETVAQSAQRAVIDEGNRCGNPLVSGLDRVSSQYSSADADWSASVTRDQVAEFYSDHYRPENLIITVTGDATTFETLVQIERLYGQFGVTAPQDSNAANAQSQTAQGSQHNGARQAPATAASQAPQYHSYPAPPPPEPQFSYSQRRGGVSQAVVTVGIRAPGFDSNDWTTMYVFSSLLGQGRGSVLSQTLLLEQGLVGHIESNYEISQRSGVLGIQMELAPAQLDKAEPALFKRIAEITESGPRPDELARAKSRAELAFLSSVALCTDRASLLGALAAGGQPAALPIDYIEKMRAVTPEEIKRIARKYLTIDNISIDEALPGTAPPRTLDERSFRQAVLGWGPALNASPGAASAKSNLAPVPPAPQQPASTGPKALTPDEQQEVDSESIQALPVRDFSTLNGPRAFVREDHSSPTVTIALLFQGGWVTEDDTNAGITELMMRSILYGTPRESPNQMATDLDQLGAAVDLVNEPDFFGLKLTVMSANAAAGLKWLRDVTEEPAFRIPDIERARAEQISALKSEQDNAGEQARDLLFRALFAGYPYGVPAHGIEDSIAKFKADQIRDWYNHSIKTQYPLIIVVGDTGGSALISEGVAGQFPRRELAKTFQAKIPKNVQPSEQVEQVHCLSSIADLGLPGPKDGNDDIPVLDVIGSLLRLNWDSISDGSQASGAAPATVNVYTEPMLAAGVVRIRLVSRAEDELPARKAFLALAQTLSKSVPEQESQNARAVAAMTASMNLARPGERAIEYARSVFTRREAAYVDAYPDRLSKIRSLDVVRILQSYFKNPEVFAGVARGSSPPPKPQPASAAPQASK